MRETIFFYSVNDEFGEFSNFALYEIVIRKQKWATSEHYFQAQKFEDEKYRRQVQKATSPMQAAMLGRDRKQKIRRDWDSARVNVMHEALQAKFTQHPELEELLLSTEDTRLVEHTKMITFGAMVVMVKGEIC